MQIVLIVYEFSLKNVNFLYYSYFGNKYIIKLNHYNRGRNHVMLNFLKENSYTIFKMIVNQIGMTIFGLVLFMATSQNDTLLLISSIFSVAFYLVLLYTMTWDIGNSEKIRIDGKRLRYVPLKGLYMSLAANFFNFIFAVLAVIGRIGATSLNEIGGPTSPEWAVDVYGIGTILAKFLEAMYDGIISLFFLNAPWFLFVIILPALITCTIAYIMGVKGYHITGLVGGKSKNN